MKLISSSSRCHGHLLVTAAVIVGLLGIAIAAFLNLWIGQLNSTVRTQVWNECMAVTEAGIEEGLAHLNYSMGSNLNANGWSWDGSASYSKTRNFGDNYVEVQLMTNAPTTIIAKGCIPAPVTAGGNGLLAFAGPTPGLTYISRTVKVTARLDPAFGRGLMIKNYIDFKGNNAIIDSYNSLLGDYASQTPGDKADVMCNADLENCLGNANIKGHLTIGPKATLSLGPNSSIGSAGWVTAGTQGIEPNWLRRDANVYIPSVDSPWTPGTYSAPPQQGIYKFALGSGNYEISGDLRLSSPENISVTGNATLWVRGNLDLLGTLTMTNFGAKLTLYVSGAINMPGPCNKSRDPADLIVYGLPTCTSAAIATGSKYECVVYAPDADLSLLGNANFFGSVTSKVLRMNGTTAIHYDENLSKAPKWRGYIITSWQEL